MRVSRISLLLVLLASCAGPAPGPVRVVAHRGAAAEAPENTLAAVRRALERGADQVEVDVRLTADGAAVLLHDDTVDRTTDGEGPLAGFPLDRARSLDAGSWFDPAHAGERIPTLVEVAREVRGKAELMLDLKVAGAGRAIADALDRAGLPPDAVLLGAWDDQQLADARATNPGARLLYIGEVPEGARDQGWIDTLAAKGYCALSLAGQGVTPAVVEAAHARGLELYVWTLNDRAAMEAAVAAGVDGVITDRPALLCEVLAGRDAVSSDPPPPPR